MENNNLHRINVEFPEFNTSDINLFFTLLDKYFNINTIQDSSVRFDILTLKLPVEVLTNIRRLVLNKPNRAPYEVLKTELVRLYQKPANTRVMSLLTSVKLESSCNNLLQEILKLSQGLDLPDAFLKNLMFSKLPEQLKIPAALLRENLPLHEYSNKLDELLNVLPNSSICTSDNDKFDQLSNELNNIKQSLQNPQLNIRPNFRNNSFGQSRYESPRNVNQRPNINTLPSSTRQIVSHYNNTQQPVSPRLCYYHERFGNNAINCSGYPCPFQKN